MVHQLDDNGTMAIVFPTVFCFVVEGHIRQYLIKEKNYLDAVIGMPANIFYGTSIPILVLKKKRTMPKYFVYRRQPTFRKGKTQNVLRKEDIDKIISTSKTKTEEEIQPPCAIKRSGNQRLQPEYSSLCRF
jgi:type I restriction enzyme M protein